MEPHPLTAEIQELTAKYQPCAIAWVAEDGVRDDAGRKRISWGQTGHTPSGKLQDVASMLVGLKYAYAKLVENLAKQLGVPEQTLHNAIAEGMNKAEVARDSDGS